MKSKMFIKATISLLAIALLLVTVFQIALDPLFQYHTPWFGLEPVITNERYQNAGVAKTFDYENALIGNSLAENFFVSDIEKVFDGKAVKLTASGSHTKDWTYLLNILEKRQPKNILFNLDPFILDADPENLKYEIPEYLYDENYVNDVNYLLNFSILNEFSYEMIKKNRSGKVPDYDKAFVWNEDMKTSREETLKHYQRPEKGQETIDADLLLKNATGNMQNINGYYTAMPDTQFVFFCSPFSILYWDSVNQKDGLEAWRDAYLSVIGELTSYENVSVYFWDDQAMLDVMCDLDNYIDEAHFNVDVCKLICERLTKKDGAVSKSTYQQTVNRFFDFLKAYDYDSLFM